MDELLLKSPIDSPLKRSEVENLLRVPHLFSKAEVQARRFPQLAASLRIGDLRTSVRVHNCLRELERYEGLSDLSQLSRFTIGKLLHLKNFGRISLINLLSAALPMILDHPTITTANEGEKRALVCNVDEPSADQPIGPLTRSEVEDLLGSPNLFARSEIQRRRFPELAPAIRLGDLPVSTRVQNCLVELKKEEGLINLGDLSRFTIGDLLHRKNFGKKSLINLLSSSLPVIPDERGNRLAGTSRERTSVFASVTIAGDALLGASVIRGRTDAKIYLAQVGPDDERRLIWSTKRGGCAIPKTYLLFDSATGTSDLGETIADAKRNAEVEERKAAQTKLLDTCQCHPDGIEHKHLLSSLSGSSKNRNGLIDEAVLHGLITRAGRGVKGSPFIYRMAEVPMECSNAVSKDTKAERAKLNEFAEAPTVQ